MLQQSSVDGIGPRIGQYPTAMDTQEVKHRFHAMGGPCELSLWPDGPDEAATVVPLLEQEVRRLEAKFSRFQATSLLSRINRGELNGRRLDAETVGLLNFAQACFEMSEALFDPSVGILRSLWDFNSQRLPQPAEIAKLRTLIGWQRVNWDGERLQLPADMALDLGGLVKEFAVDRLRQLLQERQIAGLVNLAGDIAVSALPPDGQPWRVAVQHPRAKGAIAWLPLVSGAVACSGDYERCMHVAGKRYCHLLRPDTGFPAEQSLASVTVLADQCVLAGSIATVAMLKGEQGLAWLQGLDVPFLAIDQSLTSHGTINSACVSVP